MLGALLLSREAIGAGQRAGPAARPTSTDPAHQHIFDAIRALYSSGGPVDTVTVADELRRAGLLDEVGGSEAMHELQNATPAISSAGHYAKIVQDTAMLRRLIYVAGDIAELAYSEPDDVTKALDEAETKVFKVAEQRVTDSTRQLDQLLSGGDGPARRRRSTAATRSPASPPATPTSTSCCPVSSRARSTSSAPDPAMGKTAFGLGMATHVAQTRPEAGARVLARDGPRRADAAHPVERGAGRLDEDPHRSARRGRLGEDRQGDRPPRGAAVPRRQPPRHGDGDPRQGAPDQGPLRRPRPDRHRLPAADEQRAATPRTASSRSARSAAT